MQDLVGISGTSLQSISVYLMLLMVSSLRIGAFWLLLLFWIPYDTITSTYCVLNCFRNRDNEPRGVSQFKYINGASLLPIIFQEVFVGLACGMVLSICFSSVILAGEKIAATSGLAFAAQIDPTSGAQSPVISQIFQLFFAYFIFLFKWTSGNF